MDGVATVDYAAAKSLTGLTLTYAREDRVEVTVETRIVNLPVRATIVGRPQVDVQEQTLTLADPEISVGGVDVPETTSRALLNTLLKPVPITGVPFGLDITDVTAQRVHARVEQSGAVSPALSRRVDRELVDHAVAARLRARAAARDGGGEADHSMLLHRHQHPKASLRRAQDRRLPGLRHVLGDDLVEQNGRRRGRELRRPGPALQLRDGGRLGGKGQPYRVGDRGTGRRHGHRCYPDRRSTDGHPNERTRAPYRSRDQFCPIRS